MSINLTELLTPISDTSPCGEDLLYSSDFDAIQHARRFDDPSLDQGEWVTEIKEADWGFVVEQSTTLLRARTKDLRLAVWLTEALGMDEGVKGLTQGYALLEGLCRDFWEGVHPIMDRDDAEYRLGNVSWLVARTAELLRAVPLTEGDSNAFSMVDWEVAQHVAQAVRRNPEHADDIARGKPSVEQIDASKRMTPVAFYSALLTDLKVFAAAVDAFEKELEQHAGNAAPSFRQLHDAYENVYGLAERFAREQGYSDTPPKTQPVQDNVPERVEPGFKTPLHAQQPPAQPGVAPHAGGGGEIRSRSQAVAQLRAVARYFRQTEPHSPVAYLADKAAEWSEMPLHVWLESVVKDDGSLAYLRELLGVKAE
ncbi:type VI secretion system protein TssA [Paraburkholderia sp. B3]|uniref:type VI secretion system protein TssA n=1 Tax=Paraburkholderia sp. B3 TaxID=3134791 RepID=UPI003982914E